MHIPAVSSQNPQSDSPLTGKKPVTVRKHNVCDVIRCHFVYQVSVNLIQRNKPVDIPCGFKFLKVFQHLKAVIPHMQSGIKRGVLPFAEPASVCGGYLQNIVIIHSAYVISAVFGNQQNYFLS
jgi:hypothetical protein